LTGVFGARVKVVTLAVVDTGGLGRTQVGEVDHACGWDASVAGTLGVGWDRNRGEDTALHRVARGSGALVRGSAWRDGGVLAHG